MRMRVRAFICLCKFCFSVRSHIVHTHSQNKNRVCSVVAVDDDDDVCVSFFTLTLLR